MNLLMGLGLLAGGIITSVVFWRTWRLARASVRWPTVPGVILYSGTKSASVLRGGPATVADVRYRYDVDGRSYEGTRISVGQYGTGGGGHARAESARYPQGNDVAVYYDPAKPGESVLEPGGAVFLSLFLLVFATLMLAVGALFLLAELVRLLE